MNLITRGKLCVEMRERKKSTQKDIKLNKFNFSLGQCARFCDDSEYASVNVLAMKKHGQFDDQRLSQVQNIIT